MSKNPPFNFTKLALNGFKKAFPVLADGEPEALAEWLYGVVAAFAPTNDFAGAYGLAGGAENDLKCLIAAAAAVELEVCAAREIKDSLRSRLRSAWLKNDHVFIFEKSMSFFNDAARAALDLRSIDWLDPTRFEMTEEKDDDGVKISGEVENWLETFGEESQNKTVVGNRWHKKGDLRKPRPMPVASLFEGVNL